MYEVLILPIEWLFPGKERQETDSFYLTSDLRLDFFQQFRQPDPVLQKIKKRLDII